jgi:nucleoside-diphosphate-sugar epimerase
MYGPGQRSSSLIQNWIDSALCEKSIEIYGSGDQIFSFTFVKDAAKFVSLLLEQKILGAVNFGNLQAYSLNELVDLMIENLQI